jgi:hypothetical protein
VIVTARKIILIFYRRFKAEDRGNISFCPGWIVTKFLLGDRPLGLLNNTDDGAGLWTVPCWRATVSPTVVAALTSAGGSTTSIPTRFAVGGGVHRLANSEMMALSALNVAAAFQTPFTFIRRLKSVLVNSCWPLH